MADVAAMAPQVHAARSAATQDNPSVTMERGAAEQIAAVLESYQTLRDHAVESLFGLIYGSRPIPGSATAAGAPALQDRNDAVGLGSGIDP